MIKNIVSSLFLFCSFFALADNRSIVESLTSCNPDFFNSIYTNKEELQKLANVTVFNKNQAYIPVENRTDNEKNYVYFKKSFNYKNLKVVGYYDSAMDLGRIGKYFFWGFIIENDITQIKTTLDFLEWKDMEDNLLYIANPMIRHINDDIKVWKNNTGTFVGVKTVPAPETTEKLLLIEKGTNMNLLICSIQGVVSAELLKQERPDIQQIKLNR